MKMEESEEEGNDTNQKEETEEDITISGKGNNTLSTVSAMDVDGEQR